MKIRKAAALAVGAALVTSQLLPLTAAADSAVTTFTFSDSGITVSEGADKNYKIEGTALTITDSGSYRVTGSCSDGSIKVKKNASDVTLTLDGLTLSSETTAPLACNKNSQVDLVIENTVSLADTVKNSEDYWTDQGYTDTDSEVEAAEGAVVKLKGASKVTLSGDGTLNITASAKNGIKSGATLDETLETELAADPKSAYYSYLTIDGVTLNIDTTSVYTPKTTTTGNTGNNPWGGGRQDPFGTTTDYYGDGINAESCLNIRSGDITIHAGDDGIHSDYFLNIGELGGSTDDLSVNVAQSYEGIEAAVVNFYSGDIDITASDDAVNAANSDLSCYDFAINIYGGDIMADASSGNDNDGIDSNGSINVYGGKTIAFADQSGNAFDLEGAFNVEGGTLLGFGAAPMEGEKLNSSTKQTWAIWSGSGGFGGGGFGGFGRGGNQGGSTNIPSADQSKVALMVGGTSYSIGSSFSGVSAGSSVAVMLNGSTELIGTTAKAGASYITFAGDISGETAQTATVTYYNEADKTTSSTANIGDTITVAEVTGEKEGYSFKEWNTKSDGSGLSYNAGDSITVAGSTELYAIWTENTAADSSTDTDENTDGAFVGTFEIVGGEASVTTYRTHDYTNGEENQTSAYAREDVEGAVVTDGTGQINFTVIPAEGYEVTGVTATEGTYKNIKTPADTGLANTYRITKITGDLTITVTLAQVTETSSDSDTETASDSTDSESAAEFFTGTFEIVGGEASVTTYATHDYTKGEYNQTYAYAREDVEGAVVTDGTGQINFTVIPAEGYEVAGVTATEGTYKNIKTPADTGLANTYRITKITGDLTITITLSQITETSSDSDTDTSSDNTDVESEDSPFIGTFEIVGGNASVTTYDTQDYTKGNPNQTVAYAREDVNGYIVKDGTGQINFTVIPEEGYQVASVTATEGAYKNIKTPDDTGLANTYRITKITGDLTITITLEQTAADDTDTAADTSTDSEEPLPFDPSDTDRPTPPDWGDTDRPTPPDWGDTDRPTPPDWSDTDRPTPPDQSDTDMPTPPDQSDTDMPTPPDQSDTDMPTPPDQSDTDMPTPPDQSDTDMPTPPDDSDTQQELVLFGDADHDGSVTSADALSALRHSVGLGDLLADSQTAFIITDVNHDGVVDSTDALLILRYSVSLSDANSWAGQEKDLSAVDLSIYKF